MSEHHWGVKRRCGSCEARFYDLRRDPILCPKCGAKYVVAALSGVAPARVRARHGAMRTASWGSSSTVDDAQVREPIAPEASDEDDVAEDADDAVVPDEADDAPDADEEPAPERI